MQQGRLYAVALYGAGLAGVSVAWTAVAAGSAAFATFGLATAGLGIVGLGALAFLLTLPAAATADAAGPTRAKPVAKAAAPAPVPSRTIDFEYADGPGADPASLTAAPSTPLVQGAPDRLVLPKAFQDPHEPVAFIEVGAEAPPGDPVEAAAAPAPASLSRGAARAARAAEAERPRAAGEWPAPRGEHPFAKVGRPRPRAPDRPEREDLTPTQRAEIRSRYTRNTPLVRGVMSAAPAPDVPTVVAERAPADSDPDWLPDGKTMGRCSQCRTLVYAPTARPIRLQCPGCGKTTLLE